MQKKILLIDGTAQLYRSFYAIKPLTDPRGRMVNSVYGFALTLLKLLEKIKPTHAAVMFDRPEPTHRHEIFPEYKAKREMIPEDLQSQIPLVKNLVKAFHLPIYEKPGWEADDLIGTVAKKAAKEDTEVFIFSNDKDLFQLVAKNTKMVRAVRGGKGEYELLDPPAVKRVFGVQPQQVADVLALMGDAADNIPGVPGIGVKTATALIQNFGSLKALYAALPQVEQDKVREKLAAYGEQAQQSRNLIVIETEVPITFDWEACRVEPEIPASAYALMAEFGFKRLLLQQHVQAGQTASAWVQGLASSSDIDAIVREAQAGRKIGVECTPQGLALAATTQTAVLMPFGNGGLKALLSQGGAWVGLFTDPEVTKISYDLKPVVRALRCLDRSLQGKYEDLHLVAHFLDLPSNRPGDFITRLLGGPPPENQPELLACALLMVQPALYQRLQEAEMVDVYQKLELPLLSVLADMEAAGIAVDAEALHAMAKRIEGELEALDREIQESAGLQFNIRSTQQLAEVLFDRLQLSPGRKTKTGRSTSMEVLETLAQVHPLPEKILEYRQLQKLKSTYLDVLPQLISPEDQRVHTTFHQVGAVTGRLSSSDPNLQNIPIRTQRGRELRRMIIPGQKSYQLLSADYSQIELRLLAHFSGDKSMLADFTADADIHSATAAEIFNVSRDQVTPDMRRQAKTCNFGIAYGVSPFGLAKQLRVSAYRAKEFIDGFFKRYPGVRSYLDQLVAEARAKGYVSTFLGRRRYLPDLHSANRVLREAAERMAINTPIQGSAADMIKRAMVDIDRELEKGGWKSRMILQVHDELLFEGPREEMQDLQKMAVKRMSQVFDLKIPLKVESAWGNDWMQAHA
ncbi:DNA polymerase I [candidate division FCPU426 bacterium]|nr:DNA polymerase I [candidate division FCPU426 bacterium]